MDKIIIKDLRVRGILGVNPEERVNQQDILINVVMYTDITQAAKTEDLAQTINYAEVAEKITEHVSSSKDLLIEKLITDLARLLLKEFKLEKIKLRIEKPEAIGSTSSVGIEIERS